jgi:hypothetical protein
MSLLQEKHEEKGQINVPENKLIFERNRNFLCVVDGSDIIDHLLRNHYQ